MTQIHEQLLNFVRPSEHSKYSPSSTDRLLACPASIKMTENIPEQKSTAADEGTLAHTVAEMYFYNHIGHKPFPPVLSLQLATDTSDNGNEMIEGAKFYCDTIIGWLNFPGIGTVLGYWLEKGVPIFPEKGSFGTGDCIIIGTEGCVVIDYKFGRKPVKPDAMQLRAYAAGIRRFLIDIPLSYTFHTVIVQPRTDHTAKTHSYGIAEMDEFLGVIYNAIIESEQVDLAPVKGSACFWCPASRTNDPKLKCKAIRNAAEDILKQDFGKFLSDMSAPVDNLVDANPLRDAALLKVMTMMPLINSIARDAEAEFTYRLSLGENIPGLSIVESLGNRRWSMADEIEMGNTLQRFFPQTAAYKEMPNKLRTVTEIEKELGKGSIDHLVVRPLTKKLKVQDERQKEVLGDLAAYANIQIENDN